MKKKKKKQLFNNDGYQIETKSVITQSGIEKISNYIILPNERYRGGRIAVPRALGDNPFKISYSKQKQGALIATADVDIIEKSDYPHLIYGDLYAFLFSDGIGDLIEIADKYPNNSYIPDHWKKNFMHYKPANELDEHFMEKWAKNIVSWMAKPIFRTSHDNMGIIVAKLT